MAATSQNSFAGLLKIYILAWDLTKKALKGWESLFLLTILTLSKTGSDLKTTVLDLAFWIQIVSGGILIRVE
jgi:hypothetical protein